MLHRVLRTLEFDKVKEQLKGYAASSLGKEIAENLTPSTELDEVLQWQEETDEAATVLRLKGNAPLGGIFDIRGSVKRSKIGSILSASELLEIASSIYAGRQIKKFIEDMLADNIELPILSNLMDEMLPLVDLERKIKNCVDDNGAMMDSASDALRSIRQQIRTNESRIRDKLENILRSSSTQKMLSDAIITIRNSRYVVPVKQEYRHAFGGIVHDQSSSGATLFIEPQSVVSFNNQLQEAKAKEKIEIERILKMLTEDVSIEADSLLGNIAILAAIDFMFMKAKYGNAIKASKPTINNDGYINLRQARHPLIKKDDVVPNDIVFSRDYTAIVITGPNTGGKTVTLKTLGLLTIMAQSGLQIPVLDGSHIALFKAVYADIGDEQSIEQSLSTFSSHMTNIVQILQSVNSESLVLFDELGAGTDPQEGAALAIAILDYVCQRGAKVIATTHYPELKAYGYNRDYVINASVEFDVETLSPTYKLLLGVPGRSNAFEISKRLGLPEKVIDHAKAQIGSKSHQVNEMIASLDEHRKMAEKEMEESEHLRVQAEELHESLTNMYNTFLHERENLLKKAEIKGKEAINSARFEAEEIIKDLRRMQTDAHKFKEHELIEAKKRLDEAIPQLSTSKSAAIHAKQSEREYLPGDEVKVSSINQKGHIVKKVEDNQYQVQIGIMKMTVSSSDLEFISSPKKEAKKTFTSIKGKDFHVSPELDIRGERYEDAILMVEKYIDDALLAGYSHVFIIHGKGTGALRQGVQEFLQRHRAVRNARLGSLGEGGSGVTVVEF